ncbi:unnamed protein product [Mytilus edulis]|uniref:Integrase catalytic domain-containing protein n=1 Tax=Mytilus edulis TaxID=6550 RepID=A0A8S3U8U0_MYTED|nr:unnamed protein product [Mytilus edulis]
MWTAGLDWDDQLDEELVEKSREWFRELDELCCIEIPRRLQLNEDIVSTSLHTFSDASQEAYGSVIYARNEHTSGMIYTRLIAAKSRVAPLTSVSIPRLELMAAVLGLRLALSVKHALEVLEDNMTFWSDSMNVLHWIRGRKREYKPFVANRIGEIHTSSHPTQWRHVPTKVNPADLVSRGRTVKQLQSDTKAKTTSSRKFIYRRVCRCRIGNNKNAQREAFLDEYNALMKSEDLPKTSKLLGLQPRIDENRLIRCDGRLEYAEFLSFDARYPIILPRKNWVTKLIVKRYHELGKHVSGTNQTFSALSSRFWIISGREEIREYEHECYTCRKKKAKVAEQVMAPLPEIRFKTPLHAFARTAVDFGGPFITVQGRGKRRQKRYLCLFTCLASRAVHLEVAFGLDTDSFLNAFYRMVNRRGFPKEIISDNGTNFVGANRELKELVALLDKDKIHNSISNQGIKWHFNPPLAPHFGGIHETMIKSAKRAIYAILGNADINDEELLTAFTGAEALINSRPLTYQSADPKDDTPLTPNHFLHGQLGGHFAPETVDITDFNPRKRWRRIQELIRHFWKRWIRQWLPGLNNKKGHKTDDIVLVMNPNVQRGHWPLGRIIEVFPGKDGHVRVAKVSLGQTVFMRPITKLCPLDIETSENDSNK